MTLEAVLVEFEEKGSRLTSITLKISGSKEEVSGWVNKHEGRYNPGCLGWIIGRKKQNVEFNQSSYGEKSSVQVGIRETHQRNYEITESLLEGVNKKDRPKAYFNYLCMKQKATMLNHDEGIFYQFYLLTMSAAQGVPK